jgi:hypothetical protein
MTVGDNRIHKRPCRSIPDGIATVAVTALLSVPVPGDGPKRSLMTEAVGRAFEAYPGPHVPPLPPQA